MSIYPSPGGVKVSLSVEIRCARCSGASYEDEEGDRVCLMCGREILKRFNRLIVRANKAEFPS